MNTSETIGKLAEALALARKEFRPVIKKSTNPFFESKYADLAEVIEATSDALIAHGLSIVQTPGHVVLVDGTNRINVESRLIHSSGEWIESEMSLPLSKFDAQGAGSAITYARRYAYQSIVGVAAEPDDDANAASDTFQKSPDNKTFVKQERGRPKSAGQNAVPQKYVAFTGKIALPDSAKQPTTGKPAASVAVEVPVNAVGETSSSPPPSNIHGLNITDNDLPEFGPDHEPEKPATPEEQKKIVKPRVHSLLPDEKDRTKLIRYCKERFNTNSVSALSMNQWSAVFLDLEAKGKELLG